MNAVVPRCEPGELRSLAEQLLRILGDCARFEREHEAQVHEASDTYRPSARNLLHYVALRTQDVRPLQGPLADLGLSSLGRSEAHVVGTLNSVIGALGGLMGEPAAAPPEPGGVSPAAGRRLLEEHTALLLGPPTPGRAVRIMVTLPSEAAGDAALVRALVGAGMTCARINTAHDDAEAWQRMAENVRTAAAQEGKPCRVLMDLAGPKLRTGPIEPGPAVVRVRPQRDALGRVVKPGLVHLRPANEPGRPAADVARIPVSGDWLARLALGDGIRIVDARGSKRELVVRDATDGGWIAECEQTVYITPGLTVRRDCDKSVGVVGSLPPKEGEIIVRPGDRLLLSASAGLGRPGAAGAPAVLTCSLPEVVADLRAGDRVWLDDGKFGGTVRGVGADGAEIEVDMAPVDGAALRADKGINLPDSELRMPALTEEDVSLLPVVVRCADLVGMSFVRECADVEALQEKLSGLGGDRLGIVLKIETRRGFENLPALLLAAMRSPAAGVMIARGDLAVECGYERLAEVQEEVLWLCEAAHMPVIWATQVLESLAKTGQPSRAEVTDAAMSERAECVMLNKGPYVVNAVRFLDRVLRRMQEHQSKKRPMMRALGVARRFGEG